MVISNANRNNIEGNYYEKLFPRFHGSIFLCSNESDSIVVNAPIFKVQQAMQGDTLGVEIERFRNPITVQPRIGALAAPKKKLLLNTL